MMSSKTSPYRYFHKLLEVQLWFVYVFATGPRLEAFMENLVGITWRRELDIHPSDLTGEPGWYLQISDPPKVKFAPQELRVHLGIDSVGLEVFT